jgi:HAE1 family hydrophobic/amphiphilic exporter-1
VVRLGDIARVWRSVEDAPAVSRLDGLPAVDVEIRREARTRGPVVAKAVAERVEQLLRAGALRGLRVVTADDESRILVAQLTDLRHRALTAAAIVLLALGVVLRSWRLALVAAVAIGLTLLTSVALLSAAGQTINLMTLLGLAASFTLVIDNTIVLLENAHRHPTGSAAERVVAATREVSLPVLAAGASLLMVLLPFMYLQGELRAYYVPLALATASAVVASVAVTVGAVPALAGLALGALPRRRPATGGRRGVPRAYRRFVRSLLRRPRLTVAAAALVLAGAGGAFIAQLPDNPGWQPWRDPRPHLDVIARLPRGTVLERTDAVARRLEEAAQRDNALAHVTTFVSAELVLIHITFTAAAERTSRPDVLRERLSALGNNIGGADVSVYGAGGTFGAGNDRGLSYTVKILGDHYEEVHRIGDELARKLRRFPRVVEIDANASDRAIDTERATELVLRVDRRRLDEHGLTTRELVEQVGAALGSYRRENVPLGDGSEARLLVRWKDAGTVTADQLSQVELRTADGGVSHVGGVSIIQAREVPRLIIRNGQRYERVVRYEFRGAPALGDQVRATVLKSLDVPPGYEVIGAREDTWSPGDRRQLWLVLTLSVFLIYALCGALFESVWQPLCVLGTIPMALVGVVAALALRGVPFTREAYLGVILMGGMVTNSAFLLVDRINQLRGSFSLRRAVLIAAYQRARPIALTGGSTLLALLPFILTETPTRAGMWSTLSLVLAGGVAASTPLVLAVTPALYLVLAGRHAAPAPTSRNAGDAAQQVTI